MKRRFLFGAPLVASWICLCIYGCVGDAPVTAVPDSGTGDGGKTCVPISADPGVACFNSKRCKPQTETCCTGLTGNGLIGECKPLAVGDAAACMFPNPVPWPCDKAFDCSPQAGKCCATAQGQNTLVAAINAGDGGCPVQLKIDPPDGAVDAAMFNYSVSFCATACGGSFQFCSSEDECTKGLRCLPVQFSQPNFSKTFGVCVP